MEEKRRQEAAELKKWSQKITIEAQGIDTLTKEREQALLSKIEKKLASTRTIYVQDLAIELQQSIEETKRLLNAMVNGHKELKGVFDDRGRFVVVRLDELKRLAAFVMDKQRVNRQELVKECNRILSETQPQQDAQESGDLFDKVFAEAQMA